MRVLSNITFNTGTLSFMYTRFLIELDVYQKRRYLRSDRGKRADIRLLRPCRNVASVTEVFIECPIYASVKITLLTSHRDVITAFKILYN